MFEKHKASVTGLSKAAYAGILVHDTGFVGVVMSQGSPLVYEEQLVSPALVSKRIVRWLARAERRHSIKLVAVGLIERGDWEREQLGSVLWSQCDMVPHLIAPLQGSYRQQVHQAAEIVAERYNGFVAKITLDSNREVVPSYLTVLADYQDATSRRGFRKLLLQAKRFRQLGGQLVFFSSTPAGGGVALMRHALIRLFRLLGVDAHWHVLRPKQEVFDVTKRKFHNVLQAVAPQNIVFSKHDKKIYAEWITENAHAFRTVFRRARVIVIDDPQPSGLIPFIRAENPDVKIIYRSHIQIQADLVAKLGTAQHKIWNFLKESIQQADVFVSHPIATFVPKDIVKKKVCLMPATTDFLDGLNKPLTGAQLSYYRKLSNAILKENGQAPLSFRRPYIIQVARFDPSKGIPDVIEAYRRLRKRLDDFGVSKQHIPQLVLVGNGAVDDPEGAFILQEILFLLDMDRYRDIASDIKVARVPHIDQVLNMLLSESALVLQLSHREGFEVKVTEALRKGRPVVAYRTGGIPLQIHQGVTGYLVRTGDTKKVAEYLYRLTTDKKLYTGFLKRASAGKYDSYGTVANATRWLFLANELMAKGSFSGQGRSVDFFLEEDF